MVTKRKIKKSNNKTKKNKYKSCVALITPHKSKVNGIVYFIQKKDKLQIIYDINKLSNGNHGFHIHRCGNLSKGCSSACEHFNPTNRDHGGLADINSHAGDLGNIFSENGFCKGVIETNKISINPKKNNCIVGRMIVVHKGPDDLGKGGNKESKKTGNSQGRIGCGVIGIKEE